MSPEIDRLSFHAFAVLCQLRRGGCSDEELLDTLGRSELLLRGLVERKRRFGSGPHSGARINELTEVGLEVALRIGDPTLTAH